MKNRIVSVFEYYQLAFAHLLSAHGDRVRTALHADPLKFRQDNFLPNLPTQMEYGGQEAWDACYKYLKSLEARIAQSLERHSVFFWLHLYRRIGVRLSEDHESKTDANTVGLVRQIVELSIAKYGNLDRVDDVQLSSEIYLKDVLGGRCRRLWVRLYGMRRAQELFEALAKSDQWLLTDFQLDDFVEIYRVEGFAYEYWRTTALMRAIGKGERLLSAKNNWPVVKAAVKPGCLGGRSV